MKMRLHFLYSYQTEQMSFYSIAIMLKFLQNAIGMM